MKIVERIFGSRKPVDLPAQSVLVDNASPRYTTSGNPLDAVTGRVADLIDRETETAASHADAKRALKEFRDQLETTLKSHVEQLDRLYGSNTGDTASE